MKFTYELMVTYQDNKEDLFVKGKNRINDIDDFTSGFSNKGKLINYLEEILGKSIKDVKLKYTYEVKENQVRKYLDIIYSQDLFIETDVFNKYYNLLKQNNQEKLKFLSLIYPGYRGFNSTIKDEIEAHLYEDLKKHLTNRYRRNRDLYFYLRSKNIIVDCVKVENNNSIKEHMASFETEDFKLQDYLAKGDMDDLFKEYDLDDLVHLKHNLQNKPLVDGLYKPQTKEFEEQISMFNNKGKLK